MSASILAQKIGIYQAHQVFRMITAACDMWIDDVHPINYRINDALKLVGIDYSN